MWLIRAAVAKTRRPHWVELPDDLYAATLKRLPARDELARLVAARTE